MHNILQSLDQLITSSIQANKFGNNIQALEYFKKFEIKTSIIIVVKINL